jgi:D-amino-acid dehydrogenase
VKVLVLGSGVIGVTSAWFLAKAGHEVTVVDRQPAAGLETSYGNAGEVSPGYSSPWAAPGLPFKAIKWLFMKNRPLVIWPQMDPAQWAWGLSLLTNCTEKKYEINKARMVRIAEYSRDTLRDLRAEIGIKYDERAQGTLQLFRKQEQLDSTGADIAILKRFGVPFEVLDRDGCVAVEPALGLVREKFAGGLRLTGDETGDCFKFTQALSKQAEALGVTFRYGVNIRRIASDGRKITGVETDNGELKADTYVLALGSYSPLLLKPLGIRIPVYPVKGYSITVPITDPSGAPESTVMDETYKVAVTRLGDRIRVGGTAELVGYNTALRPARRGPLDHVVSDLFPRGGDLSRAEFWTGLRPMTPDGPPIIGPTPLSNLYLNTGHGTLGWTMSAGSGRVLADMVSGRTADIDLEGITMDRYGKAAPGRMALPKGAHA